MVLYGSVWSYMVLYGPIYFYLAAMLGMVAQACNPGARGMTEFKASLG